MVVVVAVRFDSLAEIVMEMVLPTFCTREVGLNVTAEIVGVLPSIPGADPAAGVVVNDGVGFPAKSSRIT